MSAADPPYNVHICMYVFACKYIRMFVILRMEMSMPGRHNLDERRTTGC